MRVAVTCTGNLPGLVNLYFLGVNGRLILGFKRLLCMIFSAFYSLVSGCLLGLLSFRAFSSLWVEASGEPLFLAMSA